MALDQYKPMNMLKTLTNNSKNTMLMLVAALAIMTPVLSNKIINIKNIKFSGGLILIMTVYGLLDVINEIWGKKLAKETAINIVMIRLFIYLIVIPVVIFLPTAFAPKGFDKFVSQSLQVLIASELAIIITSLLIDIPLFSWLKSKNKSGFFFRSNGTTVITSLFASIIFVYIAYWGTGQNLVQVSIGQFIARISLGIIISIFTSFFVLYLKRLNTNGSNF